MKLEIIATSVEDALVAERSGADRIELCSALSEGGLTPSLGLIEAVVNAVAIQVHVIVRPHSRSFQYDSHDLAVMIADIGYCKHAGAAGIVIGTLTAEKKVDSETLSILLEAAGDMNVTFHRAFDEIEDQLKALEVIAGFSQVQRILTSGGQAPAPDSPDQLKRLVEASRNTSVQIIAGNGMTPETLVALLTATGLKEVHFGSAVRFERSFMHPIDPSIIASIKRDLQNLKG